MLRNRNKGRPLVILSSKRNKKRNKEIMKEIKENKGHPLVISAQRTRDVRRTLIELPSDLAIDRCEVVGSSHLAAVKTP
ncbi:MAG: hypothetical protein AB9Q20_07920 [Candidatus Reddybacter sp.]